jgi:hypothetical protein
MIPWPALLMWFATNLLLIYIGLTLWRILDELRRK